MFCGVSGGAFRTVRVTYNWSYSSTVSSEKIQVWVDDEQIVDVKIAGRKDAPGRPLIYRTTEQFLAHFGLNAIEDLPSEEELKKLMEEENA